MDEISSDPDGQRDGVGSTGQQPLPVFEVTAYRPSHTALR
jgi:hypothetical protein